MAAATARTARPWPDATASCTTAHKRSGNHSGVIKRLIYPQSLWSHLCITCAEATADHVIKGPQPSVCFLYSSPRGVNSSTRHAGASRVYPQEWTGHCPGRQRCRIKSQAYPQSLWSRLWITCAKAATDPMGKGPHRPVYFLYSAIYHVDLHPLQPPILLVTHSPAG